MHSRPSSALEIFTTEFDGVAQKYPMLAEDLQREGRVTDALAVRLSYATRVPSTFWHNLQRAFDELSDLHRVGGPAAQPSEP